MTDQQVAAERSYLEIYARYLDESNATVRKELLSQMHQLEQVNGWTL